MINSYIFFFGLFNLNEVESFFNHTKIKVLAYCLCELIGSMEIQIPSISREFISQQDHFAWEVKSECHPEGPLHNCVTLTNGVTSPIAVATPYYIQKGEKQTK